jgi:DNA-directed RNA polymerase subunit RPC12/RpoP
MSLSNIDKMIAERQSRIQKRKEDGTLFEEEFKKDENADAKLALEVEAQKRKMEERAQARLPNCPQCGQKMELLAEQGIIACQDCGVGMRI